MWSKYLSSFRGYPLLKILIHITLLGLISACSSPPGACKNNGDCLGAEKCRDGKCITPPSECSRNADCESPKVCLDGKCTELNPFCSRNADCKSKEVCDNATRKCRPISKDVCKNQCMEGKKQCVGAQTQICLKLSSGCLAWGAAQDCPAKQTCQDGSCVAACQDTCSVIGESKCVGAGGFQVCNRIAKGCLQWGQTTSCGGGQSCKGGSCADVKKSEGDICRTGADCQSGLLCLRTDRTKDTGACQRRCVKSSDCPSGLACYALTGGTQGCAKVNFPPIDAKCKILIDKATIKGGCWDLGCGAPDPFVAIEIDGERIVSDTKNDNFNPSWNRETIKSFDYKKIRQMKVSLLDEDLTAPDTMVIWTAKGDRWRMRQPRKQDFILPTLDNSITLYISVSCTF